MKASLINKKVKYYNRFNRKDSNRIIFVSEHFTK